MFSVSPFERSALKNTDLETIYLMRFSVYSKYFHGSKTPSYAEHCRFIAKELENTNIYWCCARDEEQRLVGVGSLALNSDFSCELGRIMVLPEHNGKGIGAMIVRDLLNEGKRANCRKAFLSVVSSNKRAIELYRRSGFELCSSRVKGQVCMEKILRQ